MKRRIVLFVIGIFFVAMLVACLPPKADFPSVTLAPSLSPLPTQTLLPVVSTSVLPLTSIFGVGVNGGSGFEQMAQAGIYWARNDSVVSWAAVESVEGTRDWSVLATLAQGWQTASSRNIEPIVIVRVTPSWAQQVAGYTCGPIRPDKLNSFASFMHDLVARYSVPPYNVKYWELWNEPDIDYHLVSPTSDWGCWGDQSDAYYGGGYYAQMLKAVYPQIKAVDPQAQVLVGGLLLDCDPRPGAGCATVGNSNLPPKFLQGILINNGAPYFDGVSFHAYDSYQGQSGQYGNANWQSSWNTTGPVVTAKAQFIQSVLSQYGVSGKYLLNTESAILCDTCSNDPAFEATKAYYLAQAYAAAIAQGLRANLWYSVLGWRNSGLLNADLGPRPAYTAFQVSHNELRDAKWVRNIESSGVKGYEFQRGDRRIWVLWSLDGADHDVSLGASPQAVFDVVGTSLPTSERLHITLNPIYVEWQ